MLHAETNLPLSMKRATYLSSKPRWGSCWCQEGFLTPYLWKAPSYQGWKSNSETSVNCTQTFSPLVVAVAANKADLARKRGNMKTRWRKSGFQFPIHIPYEVIRSVQTETLYNLSSSKNITESLKNFGGGDSDQSFVVAGFGVGLEAARGVIR